MAIALRPIATIPTDSGDVVVQLEYDDATNRVTAIVAENPTPRSVRVSVTRDSDGREYGAVVPPGSTRRTVPTSAGNRISLVPNSRGGFDGYAAGVAYPV